MMGKIGGIVFLLIVLVSCQKVFLGSDPPNTPRSNFEILWKTLDQKYSFFVYKNVDWNDAYNRYSPMVTDTMSDLHLFEVFFNMLSELRDSHVNLTTPFNVSRYEREFVSSPENYNDRVVNNRYLKSNYYTTGPFENQEISSGNVGYVRYSSFTDAVSSSNVDYIVNRFKDKKGIILDVRNNGGGSISNVFTICSHFTDKRVHVYTSYLKNGPGHNDFASPNEVYISPSGNLFTKRVCLLTNRNCYSATSFFVLAMRNFPNVTVVGDTTGGGLGAPTGFELPNGWSCRFSASMTLSPEGENFEDGIPPDTVCYLKTTDTQRGYDTLIEKAIEIILQEN